MPQANALNLLAVSILLGMSSQAVAEPSSSASVSRPQQQAQAQQTPSQMEQDYQTRLKAAKTPEDRARIQADYDRMMQQGTVSPDSGGNVRSGPGTSQSPGATGGGSVPRGQSGSGGSDSGGSGGGAGGGGSSGGR